MDESELRRCIRDLVRLASQDEDGSSDVDASETTEADDTETNLEYQALVAEVEAKLIEFLEGQVVLDDESAAYSTTEEADMPNSKLPIHQAHAYPCQDTFKELPSPPEKWPQR